MKWDQQLIKACTETDGAPHPHTDHVLTGAKWQRDQLRTDEAIERVAYAYQANVKRNRTERLPDLPPETQDYYRAVARSMIAALFDEGWTVEP